MAYVMRRSAPWKNFSSQPAVLLHHADPGFEFREVRYAEAGSWDHATTRLHIACHLDPIRQRIGSTRAPFLLVPPSAAVSIPGDRLAGSWDGSGRAWHLQIAPGFLAATLGSDAGPRAVAPRHFARLREPDAHDAITHHLMSALALECRAPRRGAAFMQTIVTALIQHALDGPAGRTEQKQRKGLSPAQLRRVRDMIEARLAERPSLVELAVLLDVSTRYLCRAFRVSTGLSPHQFILLRRVERARELIASGLSLSEAAIVAGFADHSQMAATFRKVLRLPPSAFKPDGQRTH